jgi:hypothetical protein
MAQFLTKKDGKEYLITDTPENREKAAARGFSVYDKLLDYDGNERWINQNISAKAIREKGYKTPEGFQYEQQTLAELQKKTPYTPATAGLQAAAQTMSYGLGNLASGAFDYASDVVSGRGADFKKSLAARELQSQLAAREFPKSTIAGTVGGAFIGPGLGGALMSGSKAIGATKAAQLAGIGGLEAGVSTLPEYISNPLEKPTEQLLKETGISTGIGFTGGLAAGGILARKEIGEQLKGLKQKGTEGLENLFTRKEKTGGKVSETLAPEDLTTKDLADIAGTEAEIPKPTGWRALLPEQIGKYVNNLEQWAVRKQGVSKAKQQLSDIQKIIKEDKKVFLSEIQDELEKRLFNGRTLDDLSSDEIANLEPGLVVKVQEQLAKIESDINQFTNQDYVTARLRMPSAEATPLQKYVSEMSVGGEGGYGEVVQNFEDALKLGPARRAEAQAMNLEQAGEELFPAFQRAEEELSKGVSETMDTLTSEAKEAYRFLGVRPEDVAPELMDEITAFNDAIASRRTALEAAKKSPARYKEAKGLDQEIKDLETRRLTLLNRAKQQIAARSQEYIESGKEWFNRVSQIKKDLRALQAKRGVKAPSEAEKALQEGLSYVYSGGGPKEYGFTKRTYDDPNLDDAERFSRLWKMRQILDDNINWVKYEKGGNLADDERFLIKARGAIKDELRKYSTAFENSDRIYSMFSDIREKVFGKGKKPLDRFTLSRMLTDTDTAKRYGEYLKDLRALAADPLISATRRSEIQKFLDEFDKLKLLAKDKATIAAWEKTFGPTGQGVQKAIGDTKRLISAVGESSTIGKLFGDPNKFLKVDQNFAPKVEFITGKPGIKELATDELLALTRTNNKYQKAMFNKESVTDDGLKAFYDAELAKIRSKPTPPEGPKGGGGAPPGGGQGGLGFQGTTTDRIKEGIKSYALNRLTTTAANEAAKAAGSEQGINVFEPYKDDLKTYLVSEYGIPERLADIAVGVLPNNPMDLVGIVSRGPVSKVIKKYNPKTREYEKLDTKGKSIEEKFPWLNQKPIEDKDRFEKIPEYLFHSGPGSAKKIEKEGLVPSVGKNSKLYEDETLENLVPLTFFTDNPKKGASYSVDFIGNDISLKDFEKLKKKGYMTVTKGEDMPSIHALDQYTDKSEPVSGKYWYDDYNALQTRHVEPNDYVTDEIVNPEYIISGKDLVDYVVATKPGYLKQLINDYLTEEFKKQIRKKQKK